MRDRHRDRALWGRIRTLGLVITTAAWSLQSMAPAYAANNPEQQILCILQGGDDDSCSHAPASIASTADASNPIPLYNSSEVSFLSGLQTVLSGQSSGFIESYTENMQYLTSFVFGPSFSSGLQSLMQRVASDIASGRGNQWGATSLSVSDVKLPGRSAAQNPQDKVEGVMRAMLPLYRSVSGKNGRFEWQGGCSNLPGSLPNGVSDMCKFAQKIQYAQLLVNSCSAQGTWHDGPMISRSENAGKTACGSSIPVQAASSSPSDQASTDTFVAAGKFQGCSASLCSLTSGNPRQASLQTPAAQLLNGWSDTCVALSNFTQDCSRFGENAKLESDCKCLRSFFRGENNSSDCSGQCEGLKNPPSRNYSQNSGCPPVGANFSSLDNGNVLNIAQNASSDMLTAKPCFEQALNQANLAIASAIFNQAISGGSANSAVANFGTVYTLLGPDNYNQSESSPARSTAYTVMSRIQNLGSTSLSAEFVTPSASTLNQVAAEVLIAILNGAYSQASSAVLVPNVPSVGGMLTFLRNGRFIQVDDTGKIRGDSNTGESPYKLQSGAASTIRSNQSSARSTLQSQQTSTQRQNEMSRQMKTILMSTYYELFAQRYLQQTDTQFSAQQIRKASATWRLDPSVKFKSTASGSDLNWTFCQNPTDSGCFSWGAHLAELSLGELLREAVGLFSGMYAMQYELSQQMQRIQMLLAIYGTSEVLGSDTSSTKSQATVSSMAQQLYSGKAGKGVEAAVSNYANATG